MRSYVQCIYIYMEIYLHSVYISCIYVNHMPYHMFVRTLCYWQISNMSWWCNGNTCLTHWENKHRCYSIDMVITTRWHLSMVLKSQVVALYIHVFSLPHLNFNRVTYSGCNDVATINPCRRQFPSCSRDFVSYSASSIWFPHAQFKQWLQ